MTVSATYIQLQRVIADELGDRQDLLSPLSDSNLTLSPIQNAIQSAIAIWEREPFYFNETYDQNLFTTVIGQEFYGTADEPLLATSPKILRFHILISANRYPLFPRSWQYLEDTSVNPAVKGYPTDIAYYAEQIRLYPIPDGAYPITISANERLANLVDDADTNAWTEDAYDLTRTQAKLILAQEVLHDADLAAECTIAIYGNPQFPAQRGYLKALKAETARRAKAPIRPSYFTIAAAIGLAQMVLA